jgi:hypothetical protein
MDKFQSRLTMGGKKHGKYHNLLVLISFHCAPLYFCSNQRRKPILVPGNWTMQGNGHPHSTNSVNGQYVLYSVPQEYGHKTVTCWIEICDDNGNAVGIEAAPTFELLASHFTASELCSARHTIDLIARPETWVNCDMAMQGLGTASCGSDTIDPYCL